MRRLSLDVPGRGDAPDEIRNTFLRVLESLGGRSRTSHPGHFGWRSSHNSDFLATWRKKESGGSPNSLILLVAGEGLSAGGPGAAYWRGSAVGGRPEPCWSEAGRRFKSDLGF